MLDLNENLILGSRLNFDSNDFAIKMAIIVILYTIARVNFHVVNVDKLFRKFSVGMQRVTMKFCYFIIKVPKVIF